ncbi:hypothetical protein [Streptomyces xantholiticus]|uniref:hypothetical protein n=1 Tax=Streptomyces xantholiticus TaxID=68285 RepID=UPI001672D8AA|nr:hypothetical protein [Streptomyces xantholiticus]GGW72361.1 hypothetical protein GCM10010381_66360 [Streptomyces xantholiticus]
MRRLDATAFARLVAALRNAGLIEVDDTTLIRIRVRGLEERVAPGLRAGGRPPVWRFVVSCA